MVLFATSTFPTQYAEASGSRVGNGGVGVVCKTSPNSIVLLDLVEAKQRGVAVVLDSNAEFLWSALDEIETSVASAGIENRSLRDAFFIARELTYNMRLVETLFTSYDAGFHLLPDGCVIQQIAYTYPVAGDIWLLDVQKNYWMQSSLREKALLLLHESLHRFVQAEHVEFTDQLRKLVGLLSQSPDGVKSSVMEIRASLKILGMH